MATLRIKFHETEEASVFSMRRTNKILFGNVISSDEGASLFTRTDDGDLIYVNLSDVISSQWITDKEIDTTEKKLPGGKKEN